MFTIKSFKGMIILKKLMIIICLSLMIIPCFLASRAAEAANYSVKIEPFNDQFDIMKTNFSKVEDFYEGRAIVAVQSTDPDKPFKYGYINKKGEIIVPPIYDDAVPFNGGIAWVGNYDFTDGKFKCKGKIIDINGKVLRETEFNPKEGRSFHEGILMAYIPGINKTYYITAEGKVIFSSQSMSYPAFAEANCSEGLIPVSVVTGWDYTLGIIDKFGKWVAKDLEKIGEENFKYGGRIRQIGEYHEGLARFCTTSKEWGYLDRNGNVVVSGFDWLSDFWNGFAIAGENVFEKGKVGSTRKYGIIDKNFKWVIEPKYLSVSLGDGVAAVAIERDFSNIDKSKIDHDNVGAWTYGLIDMNENIIVPFNEYNTIYGFSEGYFQFSRGLYPGEITSGYMDTKGNEVFVFDSPDISALTGNGFQEGMLAICIGDTYGYLMKRDSSSPIRIKLDGKFINLPVDPVSENGYTLVPFRAVFESLGAKVDWDGTTKTITGTKDETKIILKQDSKDAIANGEHKTLPVPVKAINGVTFVPVRFVAESLGIKVEWDGTNRIVKLISKQN